MTDIVIYKEDSTFQEDIALIKDATTKVFLISGKILQNIQKDKKYKESGYATFEEAIEVELGMKKSQAYRLIDAAIAYENLSPIGEILLPTSESQIRPIAKLPIQEQIAVWQEVAKNKVPTAKEVQEYVNANFKKDKNKKDNKISKPCIYFVQSPVISVELYTKLQNELEKIKQEKIGLINTIMDCVENERKYREEIEYLKNVVIQHKEPYTVETISLTEAIEEKILLTRTEIVETIEQYGEGFQPMILKKDKTTNLELFNVLVAIRNRFEENKSIIPNPLSERVRLADGPEPEEDIGTLKSLPRSNIK